MEGWAPAAGPGYGMGFGQGRGFGAGWRMGSGRGRGDLPPNEALTGTVTGSGGETWTGRIVYDLDEDEETGVRGRESFICIEDYGMTLDMFAASPMAGMVAMAADEDGGEVGAAPQAIQTGSLPFASATLSKRASLS